MSRDRHEWFLNQVFRYRPVLQRYLRQRLACADDIDDIIQETYLRVYAMPDFTAVQSPKSLLLKIAHNLAIELVRRRATQATDSVAEFEPLTVSSDSPALDDQLDARRRFESFCAAVDSLPPLCRRAFMLRKVYKLSQAEIAAVLGVSENTVEKHVAKGMVRCRDYLRERGLLQEPFSWPRSGKQS
jgi:RNA polymerase sigma factor (sigma-70 family)